MVRFGSTRRWLARRIGGHHYPYLGNRAMAAIEMALWDICGEALADADVLADGFEVHVQPGALAGWVCRGG
jgi:hypothetical protein